MKRIAILLPIALIAGCAGKKELGVQVHTVEVPVTRVTSCVAKSDIPSRPSRLGKRPKTVSAALDSAVAKVLEWQGYGERADAILKGCAQ